MKTAIVIHGNLRTFFMPLRENPSIRLCDLILDRVIKPNLENCDVFLATDPNDFFYDGYQYYTEDKKIEITNSDPFRLYPKIKFESIDVCKDIIQKELYATIPNIKKLLVEDPYDSTKDPKFSVLNNSGHWGASPSTLIGHYRKLKLLMNMLVEEEQKNNFKYDIILKIRFDVIYPHAEKLILSKYQYDDKKVYVPGHKAKFVYDWYGFGSRQVMEHYLTLYDYLGFTVNSPACIVECPHCGTHGIDGIMEKDKQGWIEKCPLCNKQGRIWVNDITLAPEYQLFKLFSEKGITPIGANYYPYVYRYLDINTNISLESILKNNDLTGVQFINHSPHPEKVTTKIL